MTQPAGAARTEVILGHVASTPSASWSFFTYFPLSYILFSVDFTIARFSSSQLSQLQFLHILKVGAMWLTKLREVVYIKPSVFVWSICCNTVQIQLENTNDKNARRMKTLSLKSWVLMKTKIRLWKVKLFECFQHLALNPNNQKRILVCDFLEPWMNMSFKDVVSLSQHFVITHAALNIK